MLNYVSVLIFSCLAGLIRSIYFPFDIDADTALSVATEMVGELDITDHEVTHIADMIDGEVGALVPDWTAGPGIEDDYLGAPDAPSTAACCQNCRSSSSGGSLHFMSSGAHRGCRCAELHGRFEEITFQQADELQVHSEDSGSSSIILDGRLARTESAPLNNAIGVQWRRQDLRSGYSWVFIWPKSSLFC